MTARFDRAVTCPFCGERILLADCPVVATNKYSADDLRRRFHEDPVATSRPAAPADRDDQLSDDELAAAFDDDEDVVAAPRPPSAGPSSVRTVRRRGGFAPGMELVSQIDQVPRIVVASPPVEPPPPPGRRRFRSDPVHQLPSPVLMAAEFGGGRVRPARVCPRAACHHPLPAEIDDRDPFVVGLIGNTGASKTTLLAALVNLAEREEGREALGLLEFTMMQRTAKTLRPVLKRYRNGDRAQATQEHEVRQPLEFAITLEAFPTQPIVLLLHDVPGEVYMDEDYRAIATAHLMWADALVFVTNPEETPGIDLAEAGEDQATVLNGVYEDLAARGGSAHSQQPSYPPLVMAVSKADVLQEEGVLDLDALNAESIRKALKAVGADDVLGAADRWPVSHWVAVAPMPDAGPAIGVSDLFRTVLSVMTEPAR